MHLAGSPATIKTRLERMIEQTEADEVMVMTIVHHQQARLHSYELLAETFELTPQVL